MRSTPYRILFFVFLLAFLGSLGVNAYFLWTSGFWGKSKMEESPQPEVGVEEPPGKTLYTCSMHPQIIRDRPGKCPICGMTLVPVKSTGTKTGEGETSKKKSGHMVTIDPVMVQDMGIRVDTARKITLNRNIRTLGVVGVAEDEVSVVNLRFSGWIDKIFVDQTFVHVERGQSLFTVYSPELVSSQEEFLLAVQTRGLNSPLAISARTKLSYLGLSNWQIDHIVKKGISLKTLAIRAPSSGYILHKNVVQGSHVQEGTNLYQIGNLETVWVTAQVYDFDAPWIKLNQDATLEFPDQPGRTIKGTVGYIYPTLDEKTRTLPVRLIFKNPDLSLKPGMFATVHISAQVRQNVLAIPTEAILYSGERRVVFIALGFGKYEARDIVTGITGDDHLTEVLKGLEEGDSIVISGQFMLDSETKLQEFREKLMAAKLQKKTFEGGKKESEPKKETRTYWTCPMHPQIVEDKPGTCPICGMTLVEKKMEMENPEEPEKQVVPVDTGKHEDVIEPKDMQGDREPDLVQPDKTVLWTCPMHPQIIEHAPGKCPICGMDLIKKKP